LDKEVERNRTQQEKRLMSTAQQDVEILSTEMSGYEEQKLSGQ